MLGADFPIRPHEPLFVHLSLIILTQFNENAEHRQTETVQGNDQYKASNEGFVRLALKNTQVHEDVLCRKCCTFTRLRLNWHLQTGKIMAQAKRKQQMQQ